MSAKRPGHVPWTKRRHHYTRAELTLSLTQSLQGYGPDQYTVEPAERVRFAVQIHRGLMPAASLLASIPVGSQPARRTLLEHGWTTGPDGRGYYRQTFVAADVATAAIADAYALVYGSVGDERGWNIVAPAYRPTPTRWREPWIGQEAPLESDGAASSSPRAESRDAFGRTARVARGLFGSGVGLMCAWAAWQSFAIHAGWTIPPLAAVLVLVGCLLSSLLVTMSPLPGAMTRRAAYAWGDSIVTWALIAFAFGALLALGWAIVMIEVFGTRP